MHLRYRSVLPLVAICIAFAIPAFAAKPAPTTLATQPPTSTSSITSAAALCQLGVLIPPAQAYGFIEGPNDDYYTLINPADCSGCPGPLVLTNAHVLHFFPLGDIPCDIPVEVSIVRPSDPNAACLVPNPFDVVCDPVAYVIAYPGIDDACVDFQLPLTAACCISGPVFLKFSYGVGSCPPGRPGVCGHNPAAIAACTQYNFHPIYGNCDMGTQCGVDINMWADADCCINTPTLPGSWGKVKTLYR